MLNLRVIVGGAFALGLMLSAGLSGTARADGPALDNALCLTCHSTDAAKTTAGAGAGKAIHAEKFAQGVHRNMQCVACHTNIVDASAPHKANGAAKAAECSTCHEDMAAKAAAEGTKLSPALQSLSNNILAYRNSFHAHPNKEDKSRPNATCNDCHDTHTFLVPARDTLAYDQWRLATPMLCGATCHTDELDDYKTSVHGRETQEKGNLKAAVCVDCHTTHAIGNTSADPVKLTITKNCGSCHEDNLKSYLGTYHGQVNRLGYTYTAKCFDCHGSHAITRVDDPKSKVNEKNLLKTCRQCHNGRKELKEATAGFASFAPHANAHDFDKYPQVWIAARFMGGLLLFVFAYFWAHSLLWWYREYNDRKLAAVRPHVQLESLPPELLGKAVRRFGLVWRIGHLLFALAVMTLILTGMTAFYAETGWARAVVRSLGGPHTVGIIHRVAAFTMLGIFALHFIGAMVNIVRNRKTFRFFGPDSLLPRWKDFSDAWGMFKWFVNKGPRPIFDRWTYWEKFDYWAVFWGMFIIGGSGMIMAFPYATAEYLPGWVFNVAMLVHGDEAFLCAVFLFTVHFFNNHFRPDKMPPPDIVMFTGVQSVEEFRREHTEQYNRLVKSGDLAKYLVDKPSRAMTLGSKILGLTLITFGLTLLTLVGIGYFNLG